MRRRLRSSASFRAVHDSSRGRRCLLLLLRWHHPPRALCLPPLSIAFSRRRRRHRRCRHHRRAGPRRTPRRWRKARAGRVGGRGPSRGRRTRRGILPRLLLRDAAPRPGRSVDRERGAWRRNRPSTRAAVAPPALPRPLLNMFSTNIDLLGASSNPGSVKRKRERVIDSVQRADAFSEPMLDQRGGGGGEGTKDAYPSWKIRLNWGVPRVESISLAILAAGILAKTDRLASKVGIEIPSRISNTSPACFAWDDFFL
mmetsp:Transcript_23414/g.69293  ORF Transcript_23414/g.69293 Transcript_23414/m.69293 type:complete len:256 (-) Transcript_23414:1221-1988(-)